MALQIILPTAFALSTDAFAVSVAKGTKSREHSVASAIRVGALFGGFEAGMCALGWALAMTFAGVVQSVDHWIALVLLGAVGIKMIVDALGNDEDSSDDEIQTAAKSPILWLITAIGTSIDAAAVGIAFAFAGISIWLAAPIIGAVSAGMSTIGYLIAPSLSARFGARAEIVGGLVLILIGVLIFWSHQFGGHG